MKRRLLISCVLLTLVGFGCSQDQEPPSMIKNLRVLAISAEPADLVLGETMVLEALVSAPDDSDVTYQWEWCPFTEGADAYYACPVDDEDPELQELFDLGIDETATLDSFTALLVVSAICEGLEEGLADLGEYEDLLEYIDLPDCDLGMDVTIRLTVSTPDMERVAIKRVFIWLDEPEEPQRNRNPVIEAIEVDDEALAQDIVLDAEPKQELDWYVDVPADALEAYLLRSDTDGEERRETITYDFYSTGGTWEGDKEWGSYADDEFVMRADAGKAALTLPANKAGEAIDTFFVVRDDRGGITWTTRQVRIAE